ncbi:MAG: hybrid sensor histidine kinase/response regulator, partial [Burkholderiales bacterium]
EDRTRAIRIFEEIVARGGDFHEEFRIRRTDGAIRWIACIGRVDQGTDGAATRMQGVNIDITDAREAREALREADRRKDEFLATLAHELRNPLAPIRNAVQLLKLSAVDHPAVRTVQDIMDRQVDHMVRLIDDLLDVSRITRGKLALRRQSVELTRVVQQAVETSRPNIRQQFTVSLPSDPIHLHGDAVRLSQVLANLLNNAAKYTEPDGRIALTAALEGDEVCIRISDSGIGIDPEQLPNLFQMFSQARPALARSEGGLGIGLSLARSLVEMHGGTIAAHSAGLDKGSELSVRLPVVHAPSATAHAPEPSQPHAVAMRRVLVVDDVQDSVRSLAALLRLDGNEVEMAADGIEALEKTRNFRPDLIILDLGLPRMNGYDVCRTIRQQDWGKDIFIVALTGWGQDSDRARTLAAGFNAHLVKPVGYETLRSVLASPSMT